MNSEIEVALITWALTGVTGTVVYIVRGRQTKRAARDVRLAEVGAAVEALMGAVTRVDFDSNAFAAQRGTRTRLALGFQAVAELVDGYRHQRPVLGMTRALEKALEFDRRHGATSRDFAIGPLHTLTAAHLRLTMTAVGFPQLTTAADKVGDATLKLAQARIRPRPAAERKAAEQELGEAVAELGRAWTQLNEQEQPRWRRLMPRRKSNGQLTA